jgi:nucleotide-binding universal stress UspA family protein
MGAIVVGVDRSETAHRAAERAAGIAAALGEPLHLVMAVKDGASHDVQVGGDSFHVDWVTEATQFLDNMRHELKAPDAGTSLGEGKPADALCEEAERIGASMIVVGNRRVKGAARVLGAVATDVVRHAPCDVLIVDTTG